MTVSAIVMIRWRNGQIVEAWNEFDAAGLMRQITAPAGAARPASQPKVKA